MRRAIKITRSVAYAGRPRHTLDICRPVDAVAAPVVVFFYGGGWRRGNKRLYRYVAKALARRGYVAVVPDYRIYPEARYPDFIEDAALAVRWVKDNAARFGGDPDTIFLQGHSAGAHIAAMLAIDGRWLHQVGLAPGRDIVGLIGIAGPYDFMPLRDEILKGDFWRRRTAGDAADLPCCARRAAGAADDGQPRPSCRARQFHAACRAASRRR